MPISICLLLIYLHNKVALHSITHSVSVKVSDSPANIRKFKALRIQNKWMAVFEMTTKEIDNIGTNICSVQTA